MGASSWVGSLPHTIESVFFMASARGSEHEVRARAVHRAFAREYGAAAAPLVELNLSRLERPFEIVAV